MVLALTLKELALVLKELALVLKVLALVIQNGLKLSCTRSLGDLWAPTSSWGIFLKIGPFFGKWGKFWE